MSRRNGARSASTENQRIKKMCDEGVKVGSRILSPAQLWHYWYTHNVILSTPDRRAACHPVLWSPVSWSSLRQLRCVWLGPGEEHNLLCKVLYHHWIGRWRIRILSWAALIAASLTTVHLSAWTSTGWRLDLCLCCQVLEFVFRCITSTAHRWPPPRWPGMSTRRRSASSAFKLLPTEDLGL